MKSGGLSSKNLGSYIQLIRKLIKSFNINKIKLTDY